MAQVDWSPEKLKRYTKEFNKWMKKYNMKVGDDCVLLPDLLDMADQDKYRERAKQFEQFLKSYFPEMVNEIRAND